MGCKFKSIHKCRTNDNLLVICEYGTPHNSNPYIRFFGCPYDCLYYIEEESKHTCDDCDHDYSETYDYELKYRGCKECDKGSADVGQWILTNWNPEDQTCLPGACNCPGWKQK